MATDVKDDEVVMDEGRRGDAPNGHVDTVLLVEIFVPEDRAVDGVEDMEPAGSAEGVGFALVNRDRGARAGGIADATVWAVIFVGPKAAAGFFIEAVDSLALGRLGDAIGEIHAAIGHGRPTVAGADFDAPFGGQFAGSEFLNDSRFAPDTVTVGSAPLRPIIRTNRGKQRRPSDCSEEKRAG